MTLHQLIGCSSAALVGMGSLFATSVTTQAAMLPTSRLVTPYVQQIDCAVGAHLGPLGACILGGDDQPRVVEHRAADAPDPQGSDGCQTKSVTRTDGSNSETHTRTNC